MSVLCPPPTDTARAPAKQKYHKRRNAHITPEFPCGAHTVRGACSSLLLGGVATPATDEAHLTGRGSVPRGATPAADAEGDCSLGLVLVLSLARLLVDRPRRGPSGAKRPLRLRCCASAAAPRCASLASCSPRSPLLCFFSTPRLRSSCVCVWPAAVWPLGGLLSAVCGCSNATDGGTADRARASRLAPCTRRSRSGRKTACCLVLADVLFSFAHSGSEKNALWSMAPAWYGSVLAALGQFYASSMSALGQLYVSSMSVVCQFYGSVRSVLCQFYVHGYAPSVALVCNGVLAREIKPSE